MASVFEKLQNELTFKNLRTMFYIVTPNETTYSRVEDVPDYFEKARPWFLLLVFMEFIVGRLTDKSHYALNDTITSMNAGILSLLPKIGGRTMSLTLYTYIYENYRFFDVPIDSIWIWIFAFLAHDLAYYLAHRAIHEAGIFWSFHQMHHSSEYYNLSTALRQGCIQEMGTIFFESLQSFITPPPLFLAHKYLNTLYQFWIHTEVIPKLGPLEYILNTPSHHRVHHGRNPYCIDKNYAGVLIIWDKIFGTFELERDAEKPVYGLITNVKSFDALWLQFFEFKAIGWDKGWMKNKKGEDRFPGIWNKIKCVVAPPGWFRGLPTKQFFWWRCMEDPGKGIPKIEKTVVRYSQPLNLYETLYCVALFLTSFGCSTEFYPHRNEMSWQLFFAYSAYLVSNIQAVGYYLDKRPIAIPLDILRLTVTCAYCILQSNISILAYSLISLFYVIYFLRNPTTKSVKEEKEL
uniref:Fatty acid hydroxylase domain-containing protein n=1 Tax=Panagrolaimus sp. PS1159 TaxID=55785 RepID=A0AC35G608_9BILA